MPKIKTLLKILFLLLLLSIKNISAEQVHTFQIERNGAKVSYRASLPKDTFLLYESVIANVWQKNISKETVRIRDFPEGGWTIYDQNRVNYRVPVVDARAVGEGPKLIPGDSTGGSVNLLDYGIEDIHQPYPYGFLPVNRYTARYSVDTMPFIFYVVEPSGEEAEALKQYLGAHLPIKAENLARFTKLEERDSLLKEKAKNLLLFAENFPKSTYTPQALLAAMYKMDAETQNKIIQKLLLYHFQNREYAFLILTEAFYGSIQEVQVKTIQIMLNDFPEFALNFQPRHYSDIFHFLKNSFYYQRDYWNELDQIIKTNKNEKVVAAAKEALRKDKE